MDNISQKSGWFSRMRARLIAVPRRVWLSLLAAAKRLNQTRRGTAIRRARMRLNQPLFWDILSILMPHCASLSLTVHLSPRAR